MKYVLATAGHVDHGKSTLVKTLTGIDPDRLAEEQKRQMTIDLGFAWFTLPSGDEVGIVDVPGHRDFIENMLAGVGSIDAVLIVVAADEGVMPQTVEHITILDLLGIDNGLIAVTKSDLVQDQEWMDLVEKDIRDAVQDTHLQDFQMVKVSAVTGEGLPELIDHLQNIFSHIKRKVGKGKPRLAVDRVFSIKGFGTVVTGTLLNGSIHLGDEVEILPAGKFGRIRGIESHKTKVEEAVPNSRVALNIAGVDTGEISRGNVVVEPGSVKPATRLDARVSIVPAANHALKHNDQVKLFHGTAEVLTRVRVLGKDRINPGETGLVQLELSAPLVAWKNDHFVIRRPSPQETIGGGQIISTDPKRRYKRHAEKTLRNLEAQLSGSSWEVFSLLAEETKIVSESILQETLLKNGFVFAEEVENFRKYPEFVMFSAGALKKTVQFFTTRQQLEKLSTVIADSLSLVYGKSTLAPGIRLLSMSKESHVEEAVLRAVLEQKLLKNDIQLIGEYICKKEHEIQFSENDMRKIARLNELMQKQPFAPPASGMIREIVGQEIFQALLFTGKLVQVDDEIVFRDEEFNFMKEKLLQFLKQHGQITLAQFRDLLQTSRKYALAFLDSMDKIGVTERAGEIRKLKSSG